MFEFLRLDMLLTTVVDSEAEDARLAAVGLRTTAKKTFRFRLKEKTVSPCLKEFSRLPQFNFSQQQTRF